MSAVEKHDPSVGSPSSVQGKGSEASAPGPSSEPEITPLPAPMPGLSMELEAIEPEEPSLAPLAKLPGVVARSGSNKKLKATHSPSSKSASAKAVAKAKPQEVAKSASRSDSKPDTKADSRPDGKLKPGPTAKSMPAATVDAAPAKPATTLPPLGSAPAISKPAEFEAPAATPATGQGGARERSRAWWVIGALGLVALGAGVGALMWQPAMGPVTPTPPEPPGAPALVPPRTELTVQPIAPPPASVTPPTPVVEALPTTPPGPPAAPTAKAVAPAQPAPTAKPATKPAADPVIGVARTTSKPATSVAVAPPTTGPAKPATDSKPPAVKPAVKPAAKPAAVASAPLSLDPVPQLSPPIIRQHMLVAERRFPGCVREGFGSNVSIGIVVESTGTVRKADILGPLGQSNTGRCISDQLRSLRFPPFTEGGATKFFVWSYQLPQAN